MAPRRSLLATALATAFAGAAVVTAPAAALPQRPCAHGAVRDPAPTPPVQLTSTTVTNQFGAGLAMDGGRLAVGKWIYRHPATLYVYELDGASWFVKQQLANPATGNGFGFGSAVDIAGSLLVTGDTWEPNESRGRAYVYEDRAGTWTLAATLAASDEQRGIGFGASLATDGTRVVVGATGQDNATGWSTGAVYVFEDQGAGWSEVQKIAPSLRQNSVRFGTQVALYGDWLFISAPRRNQGVVFVYRRGPGGYSWVHSLQGTGGTYGRFGTGLAMAGSTLLASENAAPFGAGFFRAFELVSGRWTQVDTLQASGGSIGPAVAADGGWAAASDLFHEGTGTVYLFREDPAGWNEVARLDPTHRDAAGRFGTTLALAAPFVVAGSPSDENGGTVEAFTIDGSACRSLTAFPRRMSIARRGLNVLTLDAGAALAGADYVVLSTLHGTSPGIRIDGFRVPLNPGAWFTLSAGDPPFWTNDVGALDARGRAVAWLDVPALKDPGMVGLEMNHAFVAFSGERVVHVSNASALRFRP